MKRIYFDNAATTPLDWRVLRTICPFLTKGYGNPSSTHKEGLEAREAIEKARLQCAMALGCLPSEIFFTSGASESNSWVNNLYDVYVHPKSHDSMSNYRYDEESAKDFVASRLNSFPLINNETGEDMSLILRQYPDYKFHVDLTQAIGHVKINLKQYPNIIYASLSAHKFGGLKGVGLLYRNADYAMNDFYPSQRLIDGHQENNMRGGTENVVGIVSMGKAIELVDRELKENNAKINKVVNYIQKRAYNILGLQSDFCGLSYDGHSPIPKIIYDNHIINITFRYLNAQTAVQIFNQYGVAISAGSACNSSNDKPSAVLIYSGYPEDEARRTIRISIGRQNTLRQAKKFCRILQKVVDKYDVM